MSAEEREGAHHTYMPPPFAIDEGDPPSSVTKERHAARTMASFSSVVVDVLLLEQ